MDEQIELQSFGLYTPKYDFASSELYKTDYHKFEIHKSSYKNGQAVTGNTNWNVNGSKSQGKKWLKICKNFCLELSIVNVMNLLIKLNTILLILH